MPTAQVNGININYEIDEPDATKGTIVLINGLADDLLSWGFQVPALLDAGYRVLRFDNRGIGKSDRPAGPYSSRQMAADAKALVDHLGISGFHLMGVSMGGMISQEYALAYPGDLKSLTLACTYGTADAFCQTMFAMWADLAREISVPFVMRDVALWAFTGPFFSERAADAAEFAAAMAALDMSLEAYLAQLVVIQQHDAIGRVGQIKVPALVLAGEEDILIPVRLSRQLKDAIPGAQWKTTPGGHACIWESPDPFNAAFLDFVSRVSAQAPPQPRNTIMHLSPFTRALAALSLSLALSFTGSAAFAAGIKDGGDLRAALTGEPDVLDPATSSVYTGAQVYEGIFSKLIDMDASGKFVPDLATTWTQVDPKTWKFDLVTNATFHNGEKFTSADVKYTFERILDPKTASAYAGLYAQIDSIDATDPAVAVFHLKSAFGPFLTNLATNGEIVNKKAIESGDPARNPVGTGPFEFVEWVQGDHIALKKNPTYFKAGLPHLDTITYKFLPVDQSRIDALSAGELDWVDAVPLQQVPALKADPRFTYVTSPVAGIPDFLAFNTKKPPFDNPKVRQAVSLAISRADIRDVAYVGTGELGLEEVPTGSAWYDPAGVFAADTDVAKAKQLLADAGYPNGLSVEYLGLPQYPELLKTGQVVRDELKAIGIDMTIKPVDVSIWYDAYVAGNYQITSAYQERTIDPDNFYSLVIKSGGPINTVGYSNPAVDALIDKAAASSDEAERKDLYKQIRTTVTTDAPLVFVHYETLNYLMNKNITGSGITPTLSLHMENVGFTQ